ncbi:MAG: hypothetical protein O3C40_32635 [Planctomycetota bacterium]|nr:hypothetical protein [Planctomycetota bacterium]
MLFLASIVFVALFYVLPGAWALDLFTQIGAPRIQIVAHVLFLALMGCVYLLLILVLRVGKFGYEELLMAPGKKCQVLKAFLSVRGCRWLNFAGLAAVTSGVALFALRLSLPYQFWPLYAAIILGFVDILHRDQLVDWADDLPNPRMPEDQKDQHRKEPADTVITQSYEWAPMGESETGGPSWGREEFSFSRAVYEEAAGRKRFDRNPSGYARYVTDGTVADIQAVAWFFRSRSEGSDDAPRNFTPLQEMADVVGLVRSIAYEHDDVTHDTSDYADFPIELMVEKQGDCEDHAILAASLLHLLGHQIGMFLLDLKDSGHLALAYHDPDVTGTFTITGKDGKIYNYVETIPCGGDQRLGDIPEAFLKELRKATLIRLQA